MFGHLSNAEIDGLLGSNTVGRIGCHAGDRTYIVPIGYAFEDGCVYAHAQEGLKVMMMRENPQVCFQVDDTATLTDWKSVIAWGKFEELKHEADRKHALKVLMRRKIPFQSSATMSIVPNWPFFEETDHVPGIFFRIELLKKTGRFERRDFPDKSYV
jgi:hypothetical protein